MRIRIIAVGTKMPAWVEAGFAEYHKRMPREITVEVKELALGNRGKNQSSSAAIADEGKRMLSAIDEKDWVIALDLTGKSWSTANLSRELERWKMDGVNLSILIGGPDGLAKECLNRAQQKWSLSALTLPHPVVRVVLMEQLYRAETILNNHPYHK
jgi:23S rRNA (pseudouridine1915-N3)-methyltransferase